MIGDAVAPFLAGAGTATIGTAVTIGRWVHDIKQNTEENRRLLVGSEEIEGDGVIEIVEENRRMTRAHREALKQSDAAPHPRNYE